MDGSFKKFLALAVSLVVLSGIVSMGLSAVATDVNILCTADTESFAFACAEITEADSSGELSTNSIGSAPMIVFGRATTFPDLSVFGAVSCVTCENGMFALQFDDEELLLSCLDKLNLCNSVIYAERDSFIYTAEDETPSPGVDSRYRSWGVETTESDIYDAYLTHSAVSGSVTIAVVDSGVSDAIGYFGDRIVTGTDFIDGDNDPSNDIHPDSHGTHIASIIAECTPTTDVKIMPVRVMKTSTGRLLTVINGINYAVEHGANIINVSLGGFLSEMDGHSSMDDAISNAVENNVCFVTCAGNESADTETCCPAHNNDAITVSAISPSISFASSFSNYGDEVDFAAPGVSISGITANGSKKNLSGTSMATGFVSACAAMVKLANPTYTPSQIEQTLSECALDLGDVGRDVKFGYGLPQMGNLLPDSGKSVYAVYLDCDEYSLCVAESFKLNATVSPRRALDKTVTWLSGNEAVATVSSDGTVTAIAPGEAIISVKTQDGEYLDFCTVTVNSDDEIIKEVAVTKLPNKTVYGYFDKSLDVKGLEITVTYLDDSEEIITDTSLMQVSGFMAGKVGIQTIKVIYEENEVQFTITVKSFCITLIYWLLGLFGRK